ncbi:MAG: ABC transporter permease [Candidatus Eremiobacterota bacterium]
MNPRLAMGALLVTLFALTAVFGPMLLPLDLTPNYELRFRPPGLSHLLGTDYAGRDILAQLVHGSRDILLIAAAAGVFATLAALVVGVGAALLGGWWDTLLSGLTDVFLTVPTFPVMAILAALVQVEDALTFGLVLSLWSWPGLARSLRAQVLTLKHREFLEAARILCMSPGHILFREILPNILPYVTLSFINLARGAITASVGIMMLGLVPLKVENWGMMLNLAAFQSGAIFLPHACSYLLSPLAAIVLFQFGLIQLAAGLEEASDPRLR